MIKWEEKDEADKTFTIFQTLFNKKYKFYVKDPNKNYGQFEGANVIKHVKNWKKQLYATL